ncbi:hypothetical protein E2C01_032687 [Portunus trituberculatus]|uniref:Uncharacterized protein n=1 Tax=Portunus trituberculatus TaxID=210409 RepID=A0A5B7F3H2_PORTR|nr:hypothetical protein [Portunus trituberculatus]
MTRHAHPLPHPFMCSPARRSLAPYPIGTISRAPSRLHQRQHRQTAASSLRRSTIDRCAAPDQPRGARGTC